MKIFNYKNILAIVFLSIICVVDIMAKGTPNNIPTPKGAGGFDNGGVVGGSVDAFVPLLIVVAITFGIWTLNRRRKDILSPIKARD